jgi:GNAT superfamily N-acetyltransferase
MSPVALARQARVTWRFEKNDMSPISIRQAEAGDADAVFDLAQAFATSFMVERSAFHSSFSLLLQSADAHLAVAAEGREIVGYLLGFDHHTFFANGRVSWVEELMVEEKSRRRGVGRRLIKDFEQWSKERQSKLIALATRRAEVFYRSLGYEESAIYFRRLL